MKLLIISLFLMSLVIGALSISTDDTITGRTVTHPVGFCNGKTISNDFDARITSIKSGESYQGTIIMVPGGHSQEYIFEKPAGKAEGSKELERCLWDLGWRVIEIRWDKALGPDPDYQYDDSHSCQHYALSGALLEMKDEDIGTSSDKWWPASQSDRHAMGISEGQTQLMFAIDNLEQQDHTKMNRVIFGGGGLIYNYYDRINCWGEDQKILDAIEFSFDGSINKCTDDVTCDGDDDLVDHLWDDANEKFLGDSNDGTRCTKLLFNTGTDLGCNQFFCNEYYDARLGTTGMWDKTHICGTAVDGHGLINSYFDELGNVHDYVDFFTNGDLTYDPTCP